MSDAIDKLETLQQQFLSLPEPFLLKIGSEPMPLDFPPNLVTGFPLIESGPWHFAGNPDELNDGFLLHAATAARLAGYRGDTAITFWLDRVCPTGEKQDLRQASANQCQRLINNALANTTAEKPNGASMLSRNLRSLRERTGLTQEETAERTKASRRSIHEHESGGKEPRAYMLRQYAQFYSQELRQEITVEDLISCDLTKQRVTQESHERPTAVAANNSML